MLCWLDAVIISSCTKYASRSSVIKIYPNVLSKIDVLMQTFGEKKSE